jgi:hypothetical protein
MSAAQGGHLLVARLLIEYGASLGEVGDIRH